jgi:hypothetical protein
MSKRFTARAKGAGRGCSADVGNPLISETRSRQSVGHCRSEQDGPSIDPAQQVELAKRIGSSQSRVAKIEATDPSVSPDLLVRSLIALRATRKDLGRAIASRTPRAAA